MGPAGKVLISGLFLIFLSSCYPHIDSNPAQIPTAEYLLENAPGNRFVAVFSPSRGSVLNAGLVTISMAISRDAMSELGVSEEIYTASVCKGRLEINQRQIGFNCYEQPPATIHQHPWDLGISSTVDLSGGLYVIAYSFETQDGRTYCVSWAYRVVDKTR